jgi:hypothetical protein
MNQQALTVTDRELLRQLRNADRVREHDDFYRENVIEEQLDDDCLREEEVAFMMGYLAA